MYVHVARVALCVFVVRVVLCVLKISVGTSYGWRVGKELCLRMKMKPLEFFGKFSLKVRSQGNPIRGNGWACSEEEGKIVVEKDEYRMVLDTHDCMNKKKAGYFWREMMGLSFVYLRNEVKLDESREKIKIY